ncbi:MAG: LicD family protein, partial [Selenomonadaceae bacterium]|nr:LicD family protein [Selenomonadaceae bacterium]
MNYDDAPAISVIMPASAIESGDPRTLESIIAQESVSFELLIVGDSTADDTCPKCLRFASVHAGVKLFKYNSTGANVKATRLIGLANARGKYVCFFDDDFVLLVGAFELLYRTAEANHADVVHSTVVLEQSEARSTSNRQVIVRAEEPQRKGLLGADRTQLLIDHLVDRKFNATIGLNLCRREFLLSNIAVLKDKLGEDEKFFAALLNLADRFYCLPKFFCLQVKQSPPVDKPVETSKPIYIADLERDEIRDGFFVTSHRKKLWNVQLQLVMEVDRICRKHGLKWFAHYGTLIGAARHHGFIPWDDDVDLVMLRADYNKFIEVAPRELKPNYFLDLWYN